MSREGSSWQQQLSSVGLRRLRDAGSSWGFVFLALFPLFGAINVIVLLCQPSTVSTTTQDSYVVSSA